MHLSLDLETLDLTATSIVLSIGIVAFDSKGIYSALELNPSIDEQLRKGRTVSESTFLWWLGREHEAREKIIEARRISLEETLATITLFVKALGTIDGVWGNGSDFDNAILNHLYEGTPPWSFWLNRDLRTLREYNPRVTMAREGVYHSALDDAKYQAAIISAIIYKETTC